MEERFQVTIVRNRADVVNTDTIEAWSHRGVFPRTVVVITGAMDPVLIYINFARDITHLERRKLKS